VRTPLCRCLYRPSSDHVCDYSRHAALCAAVSPLSIWIHTVCPFLSVRLRVSHQHFFPIQAISGYNSKDLTFITDVRLTFSYDQRWEYTTGSGDARTGSNLKPCGYCHIFCNPGAIHQSSDTHALTHSSAAGSECRKGSRPDDLRERGGHPAERHHQDARQLHVSTVPP
jgi:hypothetical protein